MHRKRERAGEGAQKKRDKQKRSARKKIYENQGGVRERQCKTEAQCKTGTEKE